MTVKIVRNARIYTSEGTSPAAGKDQGEIRFFPKGAMVIRCTGSSVRPVRESASLWMG